jgi:quinol monooxygenase YgiN
VPHDMLRGEHSIRWGEAMIIIAGRLDVDPAARETYLAECRAVIEAARAADGCLDFLLAPDPVEPGRIHVYERWESDAQLERFRGAAPESPASVPIRHADVNLYRISEVGPA